MTRTFLPLALAFLSLALLAGQPVKDKAEAPDKVSYYKDVRPLLQQHCQGCHQPAKPQGGYVMTSHADLLKAGDSDEPGVIAGHPQKSLLIKLLLGTEKDRSRMPKGKARLT